MRVPQGGFNFVKSVNRVELLERTSTSYCSSSPMIHMCPDLGGFNLLKQLEAADASKESSSYGSSRNLGGFNLPRSLQVPEAQVNI